MRRGDNAMLRAESDAVVVDARQERPIVSASHDQTLNQGDDFVLDGLTTPPIVFDATSWPFTISPQSFGRLSLSTSLMEKGLNNGRTRSNGTSCTVGALGNHIAGVDRSGRDRL
jgi:hypothetical protein